MARVARLGVLDDETQLDGARIDVAVRVGWLLRMARLAPTQARSPRLDEMAKRVGSSPAQLHRLETGKLRSGRLMDGYEAVLGLPSGALRAPVDVTCRGFAYSPPDRDPGPPVTSVREMSRLTDLVSGPGTTGGEWLAWARALSQPGAIGLPERQAEKLIATLASELGRSASHGYPTRYEAMALLRCGPYGDVVLSVAQDVVGDPHVQVLYDLMSAVGEAATPEAIAWCLGLLEEDRELLVVGGALALENMAEVSGRADFWGTLVEPLVDLLDRHPEDSPQNQWVSHLVRLVPKEVLDLAGRTPRRRLAPEAKIRDWSRSRLNRHWSDCQARARAVTEATGLPDQPVLARLLFDIAIGPHETRAVTSYMLLGALGHFRVPVGEHVAELAEHHPDPVVRDRAGRRLIGVLHGEYCDLADRWLLDGSQEDRNRALLLAGAAGHEVPENLLRAAVADGAFAPALYAAGMAGHPCLPGLAEDRTLDESARGAARWWIAHGGRIIA